MIACEIHDDNSLRGQTDGLRSGRRARHNQREVKTCIQLFVVPYALRLMNMYITDVAYQKKTAYFDVSLVLVHA